MTKASIRRYLPVLACTAALLAGFVHAAVTEDVPAGPAAPVAYFVEVEEDGSGAQYIRGERVATFPEGTFEWDCRAMGNATCGSDLR